MLRKVAATSLTQTREHAVMLLAGRTASMERNVQA
jgi:hypothetical protein